MIFLIKSTFIYSLKTSHMYLKHLDYTHSSPPPIPCRFCNPSSSKNFLSFSLKKKYSSLCPFRAAYISTGVGQNSGQGNDIVPLTGLPASFLPTCSNGPELSFRLLHCLLTALGLRVKFSTVGLSPDESSDLTHFSLSLRLSVALASLSLRCPFCWNPFLQIFPCGSSGLSSEAP